MLQTFSWIDIPLIFLVFIVEILLAADNGAALSLLVKHLPEKKRKQALFAGLYSAFFLRLIGVVFAAYLIHLFWMQLIGGIYLLYLAWHSLFAPKREYTLSPKRSFFMTVLYVELIDLLFAIDSILGAFALVGLFYPFSQIPSKLWVIYLGGILGVVAVRIVTGHLLSILDKYKEIERIIFFIVGWMGFKLIVEGSFHFFPNIHLQYILDPLFWIGTLLVVLIGFLSTKWKKKV